MADFGTALEQRLELAIALVGFRRAFVNSLPRFVSKSGREAWLLRLDKRETVLRGELAAWRLSLMESPIR